MTDNGTIRVKVKLLKDVLHDLYATHPHGNILRKTSGNELRNRIRLTPGFDHHGRIARILELRDLIGEV